MLTIGDKKLETSISSDFDAAVLAATGCGAAEHARMIQQHPTPFGIARAVSAAINPPMEVGKLAAEIEGLDPFELAALARDVAAIIAPAPSSPAEPASAPALGSANG